MTSHNYDSEVLDGPSRPLSIPKAGGPTMFKQVDVIEGETGDERAVDRN